MSEENVSNNEIDNSGNRKILEFIMTHLKKLLGGGIIAVVMAVMTAISWVEDSIDDEITQRMAPFEHLQTGLALSHYKNHDLAIPELSKAYEAFKMSEPSKSQLIAVVDPLLHSLAESSDVYEHSNHIDALVEEIAKAGSKIPDNEERLDHLGTLHLYRGKIEKAKKYYQDSLKISKTRGNSFLEATTHWNLVLCHMAAGELDQAVDEFKKARERDPAGYNLDGVIKGKELLYQKKWITILEQLYKPFISTFEEFYTRLAELKNKGDAHENRSENNQIAR